MTYLIANSRSIAFEISSNRDIEVDIFSIDVNTRDAIKVATNSPLGFVSCYKEIVSFYESNKSSLNELPDSTELLGKHSEQYKNNLYGLYCAQKKFVDDDRIQFFKEAYISCFAMEIAVIFSRMSVVSKQKLSELLADEKLSKSSGFSELISFFNQWRLINPHDGKGGRKR